MGFSLFNLLERVHDAFVEVDVFDAGKTEDGDKQVAHFLLVGFVLLGGEVGLLATVGGQVSAGHFAELFEKRKDEHGAEFLGIALATVNFVQESVVFGKRGGVVGVFSWGHGVIIQEL